MGRHENQNKKREKLCYLYQKLGITQRFNIKDTKQRSQITLMEVKKLQMEKHYEGSNVLFLESGAHSKSLQISVAFFTIYVGSHICW